jgi:hypothetical protein
VDVGQRANSAQMDGQRSCSRLSRNWASTRRRGSVLGSSIIAEVEELCVDEVEAKGTTSVGLDVNGDGVVPTPWTEKFTAPAIIAFVMVVLPG